MRIAVFHNLPSGGAKRTLYEEVKQLKARHQIDVYTLSCANHAFADLRPLVDRYEIFDFNPGPLFSSPFGRLNQGVRLVDLMRLESVCKAVAQRIDSSGYDLALVHTCQFENSSSVINCLSNVPIVYYCHEPLRKLYESRPARPYDDSHSRRRGLLNRVDPLRKLFYSTLKERDSRNLKAADMVLVNSRFTKQSINRVYGVEAFVCYHGVDSDFFHPVGTVKQDKVLSVGSLTPVKGFDFLLESLTFVPKKIRPRLEIASNFQNREEKLYLEQLADDLDVEMQLLADVNDRRLLELYNEAELVVYAPVGEPFGLVSLEAMACATPVVAVREGGIPESVVHEKTGLLTERDLDEFSSTVTYLLNNPAVGRDLGRNGRKNVEKRWTWEQASKRLEARLAQVLSGESPQPI